MFFHVLEHVFYSWHSISGLLHLEYTVFMTKNCENKISGKEKDMTGKNPALFINLTKSRKQSGILSITGLLLCRL